MNFLDLNAERFLHRGNLNKRLEKQEIIGNGKMQCGNTEVFRRKSVNLYISISTTWV